MATDLLVGGTATAKTFYTTGYEADKACDDSTSTDWLTITAHPQWWQYDFGAGKSAALTGLKMHAIDYGTYNRTPSQFTVLASNTGAFGGEEVTLMTEAGCTWSQNEWKEWSWSNPTAYRYYRVNVTETAHGTYTDINEMEMYGSSGETPSGGEALCITMSSMIM